MPPLAEEISKLSLGDEEFRLFGGYIEKQTGLQFLDDKGRSALEVTLLERMQERGIEKFLDYFDCLIRHDPKREEFRQLVELLTINETSFFRNLPQFEALRDVVLPRLIELRRGPNSHLRIWSAGCASGEEPYSIAMVVKEVIPAHDEWTVEIIATDISQRALWTAREAVYNERSLRTLPMYYRQRHFHKPAAGTYQLAPEVRKMVSFRMANLLQDPAPFNEPCDILFCRNVIIYFRPPTIREILDKFSQSLADDGYLFVGHSENLSQFSSEFVPQQVQSAFVYVKSVPSSAAAPSPRLPAAAEAKAVPRKAPEPPKKVPDPKTALAEAEKALLREDYVTAEELLQTVFEEPVISEETHLFAAALFAATGREEQALAYAQAALDQNYLSTGAHYLLGLLARSRGDLVEAGQHLTRAIYSDKDFPLAYYQLASVRLQQGDLQQASRLFRSTLKAMESPIRKEWSVFLAGFSPEIIQRSCKDSLQLIGKRSAGRKG